MMGSCQTWQQQNKAGEFSHNEMRMLLLGLLLVLLLRLLLCFLLLLFCLILLCRFVVAAHADVSMPLDTGDGGDYPWHLHQSCQGFLRTPPW